MLYFPIQFLLSSNHLAMSFDEKITCLVITYVILFRSGDINWKQVNGLDLEIRSF